MRFVEGRIIEQREEHIRRGMMQEHGKLFASGRGARVRGLLLLRTFQDRAGVPLPPRATSKPAIAPGAKPASMPRQAAYQKCAPAYGSSCFHNPNIPRGRCPNVRKWWPPRRIIRSLLDAKFHALQDLRRRPQQPRREIRRENVYLAAGRRRSFGSSAQEAQSSCSRIFIPRIESFPPALVLSSLRNRTAAMSNALRRRRAAGLSPRAPDLSCALRPMAADPVPATRTMTGPSRQPPEPFPDPLKMLTVAPEMLLQVTPASAPSSPAPCTRQSRA